MCGFVFFIILVENPCVNVDVKNPFVKKIHSEWLYTVYIYTYIINILQKIIHKKLMIL